MASKIIVVRRHGYYVSKLPNIKEVVNSWIRSNTPWRSREEAEQNGYSFCAQSADKPIESHT